MQDLIILGTGVHGAEMAHLVERINRVEPTWNFLGHIAAKPVESGSFWGHPILGGVAALEAYPGAFLVADNEFPKAIPIPLDRLATLVDPSCFVHPSARLGRGCVVYAGCFIGLNAEIGDRVFMLSGCVVNHDDRIGDRVIMASGVTLAGAVTIEADVYLGQSCTVRQFLRVGARSLIGMGAVVVKDVPPRVVMAGNPARKLRDKP